MTPRRRLLALLLVCLASLAGFVLPATTWSTAGLTAAESHVGTFHNELHVVGVLQGVATDPRLGRAPRQELSPAAMTSLHTLADRGNVSRVRPQIELVRKTLSPADGATALVEIRFHASSVIATEDATTAERIAARCGANSFTRDTRVVMAAELTSG